MVFEPARVESLLQTRATDAERRQVRLSDGRVLPYQQLLLATGGRPRRLDCPGADDPRVAYVRSVADAQFLQQTLQPGRRLAIVGGGYIGLEVAAAAIKKGLAVTLRGRLIAVDAVSRAADFAASMSLIAARAHIAPRQLADERWALKDLARAA